MAATWFQAKAEDFLDARRKGFDAGASIIHANLGHISEIRADRAIAQTKMTIDQRAEVHGVLVDVPYGNGVSCICILVAGFCLNNRLTPRGSGRSPGSCREMGVLAGVLVVLRESRLSNRSASCVSQVGAPPE